MVFSFYHMYIGKAYYMVPVGPMVYRFMGLVLSCRGVRVYTNSVPGMASHLLPIEAERMSNVQECTQIAYLLVYTPDRERGQLNLREIN